MAASLRQQLANRPDVREKDISLVSLGGEPMTVKIRRLTVAERDRIVKEFKLANGEVSSGVDASLAIVTMGVVPAEGDPPLTKDDVLSMPASLIDEIGKAIMEFNGWSEAGRAQLADQFRASA